MAQIIRGVMAKLMRQSVQQEVVQHETQTAVQETEQVTNIAFVTMAEAGTIDEVTATEHLGAFAPWEPDVQYTTGNLRKYGAEGEEKLYKCVQAHKSQADWSPDKTPALWALAGDPAEEWPEWSQPIGAQDAYMAGDKVSHNGKHWISNIDNNVCEPSIYGWELVE